eukprot:14722816-Ditylum_brightwellii.AAC.1
MTTFCVRKEEKNRHQLRNNIKLKDPTASLQEGWMGKPKGLKQCLKDRPKDAEHRAEEIGMNLGVDIIADRSPKGHPEVTGE